MMRGPTQVAAAVRRADGTIESRVEPFTSVLKKRPYLNVPFVRGVIALFEMMGLGMGYLNWSSGLALESKPGDAQGEASPEAVPFVDPLVSAPVPAAIEAPPAEVKPSSGQMPLWAFGLTAALSLALGMLLFVALPNVVADKAVKPFTGNLVVLNLVEGAVKLTLFVAYVWFVGQRKDIKRVFEYHGAEHKVVYAAENSRPLTPEGARPFDTPHPRCGTGFALLTVLVSIVCFSVLPWTASHVIRVGMRLLLLPVVAGISYEIIKATVNPRFSALATLVVTPGMWLQRLTTKEPNDEQLEVACVAMRVLLAEEERVREVKNAG